tara:strand:- start:1533 stop:2369 length:837 start_codon:yes stop_codon:yes gene_type:complete
MLIDIYTKNMIMKMKMKASITILTILFIQGCALAPGMQLETERKKDRDFINYGDDEIIYVEDLSTDIFRDLAEENKIYKLGVGDRVNITVWGLPEVFPLAGVNSDINSRVVVSDGTFFFPYAGNVIAKGRSASQIREDLTNKLEVYFNEPQVDVIVTGFQSQRIYVLGEVARPQKISLTQTPLSLTDALGLVNGLNNNTSNSSEVYVIRQADGINGLPRIFRADFSSPATFLNASSFYLAPQDIVYVNANGTARWNRVISQFFPFSSFLNSVDNLVQN